MQEIWKDVVGYEGLYQVSNMGRVLSVKFGPKSVAVPLNQTQKIMSASRSSSGYFHVQLYKGGKSSTKLVHRLVAEAFIPNPYNLPQINHKDGNKANNRFDNLEWVTVSENQKHAIKLGLREPSPTTGKTGVLASASIPVLQYDLNGNFVKRWDCGADAARFYKCCNASGIYACANGRHRTCKGFMWRRISGARIPDKIPPYRNAVSGRTTAKVPVIQCNINGDTMRIWSGMREISKETGFNSGSICKCCKGRQKTAYGYVWKYAD